MEYSGAASYVNAKAAGMLRKAFVGERASALFAVKTLPKNGLIEIEVIARK